MYPRGKTTSGWRIMLKTVSEEKTVAGLRVSLIPESKTNETSPEMDATNWQSACSELRMVRILVVIFDFGGPDLLNLGQVGLYPGIILDDFHGIEDLAHEGDAACR